MRLILVLLSVSLFGLQACRPRESSSRSVSSRVSDGSATPTLDSAPAPGSQVGVLNDPWPDNLARIKFAESCGLWDAARNDALELYNQMFRKLAEICIPDNGSLMRPILALEELMNISINNSNTLVSAYAQQLSKLNGVLDSAKLQSSGVNWQPIDDLVGRLTIAGQSSGNNYGLRECPNRFSIVVLTPNPFQNFGGCGFVTAPWVQATPVDPWPDDLARLKFTESCESWDSARDNAFRLYGEMQSKLAEICFPDNNALMKPILELGNIMNISQDISRTIGGNYAQQLAKLNGALDSAKKISNSVNWQSIDSLIGNLSEAGKPSDGGKYGLRECANRFTAFVRPPGSPQDFGGCEYVRTPWDRNNLVDPWPDTLARIKFTENCQLWDNARANVGLLYKKINEKRSEICIPDYGILFKPVLAIEELLNISRDNSARIVSSYKQQLESFKGALEWTKMNNSNISDWQEIDRLVDELTAAGQPSVGGTYGLRMCGNRFTVVSRPPGSFATQNFGGCGYVPPPPSYHP